MRLMNQRDRRTEAEYNLEFRGSVRDLQKRALFMKFYPEICLEITQKCIKITLLLNVTKGSIRLPDADFFWIIP